MQRNAVLNDIEECKSIVESSKTPNPLFVGLLHRQSRLLRQSIESWKDGNRLFELYGDREDILYGLLQGMQSLDSGDLYAAVTLPSLWCRTGLGLRGRFYSMNLMASRRGVGIKRIFMIEESELAIPRVQDVLRAHSQAQIDLGRREFNESDKDLDDPTSYVGVEIVSAEEKSKRISYGLNFGLIRKYDSDQKRAEFTRIALDYQIDASDSQRARITCARLWKVDNEKRQMSYLEELRGHIYNSKPVSTVIGL